MRMKKLLLLLMLLFPVMVSAQEKISVVTLKNGAELKGVITAIDPADAVTIVIAGIETKVKMADVAKVEQERNAAANAAAAPVKQTEPVKQAEPVTPAVPVTPAIPVTPAEPVAPVAPATPVTPVEPVYASGGPSLDANTKLIIRDEANYPEMLGIKVGDEIVRMVLVRGGDMNMGWDGKGSLSMSSEPVHPVKVTSFYMSASYVTSNVFYEITGSRKNTPYIAASSWEVADAIVGKIAEEAKLPLRLPTEAEWEFAACSPVQNQFFTACMAPEYCSDWFDVFNINDSHVTDPTGPQSGKYHVTRSYEGENGKLNRAFKNSQREGNYFRVAIKAKDLLSKM